MLIHAERHTVMANLSVCLSVTLWYCIEMNAHIVKLFPQSGRGMNLVFERHRSCEIPKATLSAEALNTRGWENFVIFDRNRRLFRKQYEIGPWLLWITNRKS